MTAPTVKDVERAIASVWERDGVVVGDASGRLLAERSPAPGGAAVLIVLGGEPFAYPSRPQHPRAALAGRPSPGARAGSEGGRGRSGTDRAVRQGSQPSTVSEWLPPPPAR